MVRGKIIKENEVKGEKLHIGGTVKKLFSEKYVFLAIGIFEPGESMKAHYHTIPEEIYYVLKGSGEMILGDKIVKLEPGMAIYIPPKLVHSPRNTGDEPLIIAFFHAPPETGEYMVFHNKT